MSGNYENIQQVDNQLATKTTGRTKTINSQAITILDEDRNGNVRKCEFSAPITDGGAGYAVGCEMTDTATGYLYKNEGSTSSCDFNQIESSSGSVTAVNAGAGMQGGGSSGSVDLDVAMAIYNDTGGTLVAGTLLTVDSYDTTNGITFVKADANNNLPATHVVETDINNAASGTVYPVNRVTGLDTSGRTIGDKVYQSTTAGEYVYTAPTGADELVQLVGVVKVVDASVGEIEFFPGAMIILKNGQNEIQDGIFSADAAGRAKMANAFFDQSTFRNKVDDGAVEPAKMGVTTVGGMTTQVPKTLTVDSATVKALLDGVANSLDVSLPVGTFIYDFVIWTQTAAGSAGTVKVGTDANWNDASNDDALVAAHDLNAQGTYKMSNLDAGTTPAAPSAANGIFASGEADLTIESSADLSSSSWVGGITIFYI